MVDHSEVGLNEKREVGFRSLNFWIARYLRVGEGRSSFPAIPSSALESHTPPYHQINFNPN